MKILAGNKTQLMYKRTLSPAKYSNTWYNYKIDQQNAMGSRTMKFSALYSVKRQKWKILHTTEHMHLYNEGKYLSNDIDLLVYQNHIHDLLFFDNFLEWIWITS